MDGCNDDGMRVLSGCDERGSPVDTERTIVCFGDSLTYGTGAHDGSEYPARLSDMLGKEVVNAGVSGDTTARALSRLERDVLSQSPGLVLITLGGNDLKNGVSTAVAFENLRRIVETIQASGAVVIIGGVSFPFMDRGYGKGYRDLAEDTGALLIPNILEGIMGTKHLMSDPIHPNDEGYRIMAERFHELIVKHAKR